MRKLYLLVLAPLVFSCNNGAKPAKLVNQMQLQKDTPVLKRDIIGDWRVGDGYAGIDTANARDFPDFNIESSFSFYSDGRFKRPDIYYTENNNEKRVAGYISKYRVNGDTLFVYEPNIKHWYALYTKMNSKTSMEIGSREGYSHLDNHFSYTKISK